MTEKAPRLATACCSGCWWASTICIKKPADPCSTVYEDLCKQSATCEWFAPTTATGCANNRQTCGKHIPVCSDMKSPTACQAMTGCMWVDTTCMIEPPSASCGHAQQHTKTRASQQKRHVLQIHQVRVATREDVVSNEATKLHIDYHKTLDRGCLAQATRCLWISEKCVDRPPAKCVTQPNEASCNNEIDCSWNPKNSSCYYEFQCGDRASKSECQLAGCIWYDDKCVAVVIPCSASTSELCVQDTACVWNTTLSKCAKKPPTCGDMTTEKACITFGGCTFANNKCIVTPPVACSSTIETVCVSDPVCMWADKCMRRPPKCSVVDVETVCWKTTTCMWSSGVCVDKPCYYGVRADCLNDTSCSWDTICVVRKPTCADMTSLLSCKTMSGCAYIDGVCKTDDVNICLTRGTKTSCDSVSTCEWYEYTNYCHRMCSIITVMDICVNTTGCGWENMVCTSKSPNVPTNCSSILDENTCLNARTLSCMWSSGLCKVKEYTCADMPNAVACDALGKDCTWATNKCIVKPPTPCSSTVQETCVADTKCRWTTKCELRPLTCADMTKEETCLSLTECIFSGGACVTRPPVPCSATTETPCVADSTCRWNGTNCAVRPQTCSDMQTAAECTGFVAEQCIFVGGKCTTKPCSSSVEAVCKSDTDCRWSGTNCSVRPAACADYVTKDSCSNNKACLWLSEKCH